MNEKFWTKVEKTDSCWLWTASLTTNGYGQFHRPGCRNGNVRAHKFLWESIYGSTPKGLELHHECENKRCVNPDHLKLVTRRYHPDSAPTIQRTKTRCPQGHVYTTENTWRHPRSGHRMCRTCNRLRSRARLWNTTFQEQVAAERRA